MCQLDALRKCTSPAALKKTLRTLPKTLYETYDRILANIGEEEREGAFCLLQWLAFSVRPISLDEAVEVLATDPDAEEGEPMFDPQRRFYDPRDVLMMCSSLVTLTASKDHWFTTLDAETDVEQSFESLSGMQVIILAHFSFRENLTSDHLRMREERVSFYYFNERLADTSMGV